MPVTIVVPELGSLIKEARWSSRGQENNPAFITAQQVTSGCTFSEKDRKSYFLFSGLFSAMTLSSGSSQVAISKEGVCGCCSCSAGLCLVSLMLSKADHTLPSTTPADQHHDPFAIHLPCRLLAHSNLYFPGTGCWHATTFFCWKTALFHCTCFLQWDEVDEWLCLFKGK